MLRWNHRLHVNLLARRDGWEPVQAMVGGTRLSDLQMARGRQYKRRMDYTVLRVGVGESGLHAAALVFGPHSIVRDELHAARL